MQPKQMEGQAMFRTFGRYIPKLEDATCYLFYLDPDTGKYLLHALNDSIWPTWLYVGMWTDGELCWFGSQFKKPRLQKVCQTDVPEEVRNVLVAKIQEKIRQWLAC
jgi:hypothetical protein